MPRIQVIAGPTASGKSALALRRAVECGGTIVNADSMQVYDGLPILTAQPSEADYALVPHRLYAALAPREICSAERWRGMAVAAIEAILTQGGTPIVVGGTGLYLGALLYGLSPIPPVPLDIRAESIALQRALGNPGFHARLAADDPAMAARLHPNDTQRLVRAWEVWRATGVSLDAWQALPRAGTPDSWRFDVTLVLPARADLYARCDLRLDGMVEAGALDEIAAFMATAPGDAPLTGALGYRPLRDHILGQLTLADAAKLAKAETRQYAKRQTTWFRHQIVPSDRIGVEIQAGA